ncbi:hypothetical protein Thpro_020452 [Acidihalobacter prosperus]|uniref:JmjC domain-containing protein n=1 Tax=Acidihalobacter prosperus TaxID=160660 RepID=A0A1A6C854_9GAMM|nr:hypothetical protein Thpro_020452 [Acidihalobacter prosperus]
MGDLAPRTFLRDYWQRKPLLVRQAFAGIRAPLDAEELAGLALESDVPSRLVQQHDAARWSVRYGPFEDSDFAALPDTHWTLLVTDLEKFVPALHDLVKPFRFLPDWRIDDLMISYAAPQGSVGPHTDAYDVFLLQLEGRRRWQIDTRPVDPGNRLPGAELSILAHFEPESEWVLEPGDMLYLPPGVAHYGLALDPCMTASIGFRAPSQQDLVSAWLDDVAAALDPERRFGDAGRAVADNPGEIDLASRDAIIALMREALARDDVALERWFGRYITEPRADLIGLYLAPDNWDEAALGAQLASGRGLKRNTAARLAYFIRDDRLFLYADGQEYPLDMNFLEPVAVLCQRFDYPAALCRRLLDDAPGSAGLMVNLLERGILEAVE